MITDRLNELFELQELLNRKAGVPDLTKLTPHEQQSWLLKYTRAMSQELAELIDCVPWKWWAKYQTFDTQNAKIEIIDLLHFLISLCMIMRISPDDLVDLYKAKHRVNMQRQDAGYAVKLEHDCRHIGVSGSSGSQQED